MIQMYVANTDNDWFDFLKSTGPHSEVNFWKPSQQLFKAIDLGGLFVFRLKSPRNVIGGYGVLVSSVNAPISLAWESFGIANGVASESHLVTAIAKYRETRDTANYSQIGCRILADPVFFDPPDWFEVPEDWSNNIVTGKVYGTSDRHGQALYDRISERIGDRPMSSRPESDPWGVSDTEQARFGEPVITRPRLGQGAFRVNVSDAYRHSCAITDTKVLPALDAAHIRPYAIGGDHSVQNGILLRKDVHSVFDAGFATFDEEWRFIVSPRVKEVFNNGNEYRRLHGKQLALPERKEFWPSAEHLSWHRDERFERTV
ncbi:MAG: HNH endonuclease [Oceanicaulis sp.]